MAKTKNENLLSNKKKKEEEERKKQPKKKSLKSGASKATRGGFWKKKHGPTLFGEKGNEKKTVSNLRQQR